MAQKTILVVEDEEQVRTLIHRVLNKRGYNVIVAVNGRAALEIARSQLNAIDLVISDVVMPEMGGTELLRELRALGAELPFLYMTGYARADLEEEEPLDGAHVIQKPFTPAQLLEVVNQII